MTRVLFGALLAALAVFAQEWNVGSQVTDFTVADLAGKSVSWPDLKGGTTVILFIATKCPISNGYNERMNALYKDYTPRGVKFVAINANATEPARDVAEHAKQNGFAFPVYKDSGVVADRFNAQVTPEAFVVDSVGVIRYHGYIDDSLNPARIQKQGLRTALDAVLAGKPVEIAQTKAFGCTIKRKKR
jgi:glutathione peroxidase-family protein